MHSLCNICNHTSSGHVQSRVIAAQPSPPSPLSLHGRGGAERILMTKLPTPREGEGQGVRGPDLTLLMPCPPPVASCDP